MIKYAAVLLVASAGFCIPGMFTGSWSRTEFLSEPHPWLSDKFDLFSLGTSMEVTLLFNLVTKIGYASTDPSEPPEPQEEHYIWDLNGRLWILQAGGDATLPRAEMFFLRATAGAACILLDYQQGTSDYNGRRFTETSWEPAFSVGLGSRFDLDFIPVISRGEFSLSLEQIGSCGLISGELKLGI